MHDRFRLKVLFRCAFLPEVSCSCSVVRGLCSPERGVDGVQESADDLHKAPEVIE